MNKRECIAMLLAGGKGSRLGMLTKNIAKPALPFGGKYRIIDFTLSNCFYSNIDTVGVLTQYKQFMLNSYISTDNPWILDNKDGGVYVLPPQVGLNGHSLYKGTADAIYQNIDFVQLFKSNYVLILSGDHIYKMDYNKLIKFHKEKNADATISVIEVPYEEASRFGIMNTDKNDKIVEFEEKPREPKSNKASMGIYIFNTDILIEALIIDSKNLLSVHDFGKNIIPMLLNISKDIYAYPFKSYWRDVGTIESYYQANMDMLNKSKSINLNDTILSKHTNSNKHIVETDSEITNSLLGNDCIILGKVENSILSNNVYIGKNTIIKNSVLLNNVKVDDNSRIINSIINDNVSISSNCNVSSQSKNNLSIICKNLPERFFQNNIVKANAKEKEKYIMTISV